MNAHRKESARSPGAAMRVVCVAAGLAIVLVAQGCHSGATRGAPAPASQQAVAGGTASAVPARAAAAFPVDWRFAAGKPAMVAAHAMIASNSQLASDAGVEVLHKGGNAVDAAVAVGFALAVTLPEAGNIGGGGFMVIRMADGRSAAFDYREVAPLAATANMYAHSDGSSGTESVVGPLAAGVPGAVAGLAAASKAFGRLPLRDVHGAGDPPRARWFRG